MRARSVLGAVVGVCVSVSAVVAQEENTPPPIFQVNTFELEPGTIMSYRAGQRKQAETAKAAGVSSSEMGWWAYFSDNQFITVRPRSRDTMFANSGLRAAIQKWSPAADSAITAAFAGVEVVRGSNEIVQENRNLSYAPAAGLSEMGGMQIMEMRIAPGQGAAFRKTLGEMIGILGELNYPYPVTMYQVRYGEMRSQWVTFFDSRENFHGVNSFNRLFAAHPEVAKRAGPIYEAFLKTISGMKTTEYTYAKDMSFPPGS